MTKRHNIIGVLLTLMLLIGCSMTTLAADWVKIGSTTYTMTNTATRIDADIALMDYKAQGLTSSVTANIGGTSYSGYTNVYNAMYEYLVANCTHKFPATGTPNAAHSTGAQYIWPEDSQNDAIWYIPKDKEATFQHDDAGKVGSRLVVVGGGTIKRVMDQRRFYLTGNSNLVLCLQGQLTIDGGGAPGAALAILSVASGKVYIAGSVKIKDSHGQRSSASGGGGAVTQRGGTIYMMDNAQILNCNSKTTETDPEPETNPNPYYISHGGAVAMFDGTFKMMGNAKISGCTSGYGTAAQIPYPSLGGAVYLDGGTFTMNGNATIENCTAMAGGAIYIKTGTFTMNGGLIGGKNMTVNWSDGTTTTYPDVNTTNYTYITDIVLNTSTVTRNMAKNAGAIYAQGGTVKLNGGVIAGNETNTGVAQPGTIKAVDNLYNGQTISTYYGSCILMQGTAQFECNDGVTIYGNTSDGPAVFLGAGKTSTPNTNNVFKGGEVKCNFCQTKYGAGVSVTTNVVADFKNNTKVSYNTTTRNGGGMLVLEGGEINIYDNVEVNHNTASSHGLVSTSNSGNGGAFRVVGTLNVYGGTISYNYARGWDAYQDPKDYTGVGGAISATSDLNGPQSSPRLAVVNLEGGVMQYNKASNHGGAVYLASSIDYESEDYPHVPATFNLDGTEISHNTAARDGGGCYLTAWDNGRIEVGLNNGDLKNNDAGRDGGGICVAVMDDVPDPENPGQNLINAGHSAVVTIGDNDSGHVININSNTAYNNGGGVALKKGDVMVQCGNVKSNSTTTGYGGGIYVTGGDCEVEGGTISSNTAAQNGGGIYLDNGDCTMSGGNIGASGEPNTAVNGGGIFADGTMTITSGNIQHNVATSSGGGIYANNTVDFSDGNVNNNQATANGGGVCISSSGTLKISGSATMTGNSVVSGQGGGVYQGGIMTADGSALTITNNTKSSNKNNVYLPNTKTIKVLSGIDPTGVNLGIYTENEAVQGGADIPVLTSDAADATKLQEIYDDLIDGSSQITDDREVHKAKYPGAALYTLYFTKIAYDFGVFTDSEPFANPINSPLQLYKYMCWVNGINGFTQKHASAEGNVTADINMGAVVHWIPIGEKETSSTDTDAFSGTFNGNGHVISNLHLTGIDDYTNYGLFGRVTTNAQINDVFIEDFTFVKNEAGTMGTLVGLMQGGTMKNSIASGTLTTTHADCIEGGLVGQTTGGTIHSSCATSTITGYQMGGLVGNLGSGSTLKNSFASVEFSASGSNSFMGGLVGKNVGTVENCYSRVRGVVPATTYFGYLAGDNDGGILKYSYSAEDDYVSTNGTAGTQTGIGTYGPTTLVNGRYGYLQADQQIDASNSHVTNGTYSKAVGLTGLLATLNHWVKSAEGGAQYAQWMRTSASPINGDYPLLQYSGYECVASTDNIALEYGKSFNDKFDDYVTAGTSGVGTIYLYKTPAALTPSGTDPEANVNVSNYGKATKLYIHEDVALKPASVSGSKATGDIEAYVGITLDNSAGTNGANPSFGGSDAIDWHFFSSALKDAKTGLVYSPTTSVAYGSYPSQTTFDGTTNQYFPANLNSYYNDWDLYAYYEPDYHWINLKRNSLSHWHEDANAAGEHEWINYPNDTRFEPGHGYMVALKDEGYLQAYGTLNTNTGTGSDYIEVPLSYTSGISWTTRQGHNLLGNPYQSYLDFDLFAEYNNGLWGSDKTKAYYIIIDEDQKNYVEYAYGSSENPFGAGRYLHPHQGFMIIVSKSDMFAKFDNRMRNTTATGVGFRGNDRPNYPLVNLMATDRNGNRDLVTVELGRPDKGGAPKQQALRTSSCSLWCRYEDEDYALVFTQPGLEYANIRFAADEDAEFTMTWSTHNGEFSYLHLIDNMTGDDIDCLNTSEYTFSARESDYNSRFRLVFDYTGIDDHEVTEPVEGPTTFAYYANGEIHLTGAPDARARLQIIDMTGRVIVSRDGVHTVSTTGMAAGVYVLRLTTANGTRTQKIILN